MKNAPSRKRSYVLLGSFIAKYQGKKTDDPSGLKVSDFRIYPYEASMYDAIVMDASFLPCIVDQENYYDLDLDCPLRVYPKNSDKAYKIQPNQLKIYRPKITDVSQQGINVNGTLSGTTVLHLKDQTLGYNPISIPTFEVNGSFPGFKKPKLKPTTDDRTNGIRIIDYFKSVVEVSFLLFIILLLFVLAYSIFSVIHPILLLIFAGIFSLVTIVNAIPTRFTAPIIMGLKKLAIVVFYSGGVLLFLGIGSILFGNLVAYFFFWVPLIILFFLIDYISRYSWLILRNASILAIVVFVLSIPVLVSEIYEVAPTSNRSYDPVPRATEISSVESVKVETQPIDTMTQQIFHKIIWHDFERVQHEITYSIDEPDYLASQLRKKTLNIPIQTNNDFGVLFSLLLENEPDRIQRFIEELDSIRQNLDLNEVQFAHLIVSLVQQIDYSLLSNQACSTFTSLPCEENVKYGVYTPTEFLFSLKGDCDTKALLLYLLFDQFGYDVALLGSLQYQHAMIALGIPGNGVAINVSGKPYYVWESTSPGWKLGMMPPENNLLQFWEVILVNNQNQLQ